MSTRVVAGVDISKDSLYVVVRTLDSTLATPRSFSYDENGLAQLFALLNQHQVKDVAFESTGGYERLLFQRLQGQGFTPYQLEARSVQELARSFKKAAKTDKEDCHKIAMALLIHNPKPSYCPTDAELNLGQLYDWRAQLMEERTRLRNQNEKRAHQKNQGMAAWFQRRENARLEHLNSELKEVERTIKALVKAEEPLAAKAEVLESMVGIGEVSAWALMAKVPELGSMTPKQCAKLVGLAPLCNQSGQSDGVRRTQKSRLGVKSALWMATLSATRKEGPLKEFYDELVGRGKHKSVARVAVMRRMICALNAMVREMQSYDASKLESRVKDKKKGAATEGAAPTQADGREVVGVSS